MPWASVTSVELGVGERFCYDMEEATCERVVQWILRIPTMVISQANHDRADCV